ncbi:hypothetical protein U1Q18_010753 [Sarracenia purpurea var. burkii]
MKNLQRSTKLERNPSIRQLFPPKALYCNTSTSQETQETYDLRVRNQCCPVYVNPIDGSYNNSKPLLLPAVLPENVAPIISSQTTLQRALPYHFSTDQSTNSNGFHVDDRFPDESLPSPETVFSSFPSFRDKKFMNFNKYVPLYRAALKGDWEKARWFVNMNPGAQRARITKGGETALHIAAGARRTKFVEELVKEMSAEDLGMQNIDDNTALCFAAASGITKIAEVMVKKNRDLAGIRGSQGVTPVYMAALLGHRDMVWYLYSVTHEHLTFVDCFELLVAAIKTDLYDFALHILRHQPKLATYHGRNGETALHVLARKPSAFFSGSRLGIWEKCIYPCLFLAA